MILLIDNYDSFVHNLARYARELGHDTRVVRTDAISVEEAEDLDPAAIILSPGPCTPREAGVSVPLIRGLGQRVPILGVCLGHQAIAVAYGGEVVRGQPIHGRTSLVRHDGRGVFAGLPQPLEAARYHSLVAREESLPATLEVTARLDDGTVMALRHREHPVVGVQFHPESVLTTSGHQLLANFLAYAAGVETHPAELGAGGREPTPEPPPSRGAHESVHHPSNALVRPV